jgi:hypothetical protein
VIDIPPRAGNADARLPILYADGTQMVCAPAMRRTIMRKYRIFGAAIALSAALATPALAEVIQEPGNFAFFYPNGDLGLGYSQPANAMAAQAPRTNNISGMRMSVKAHRDHRAPAIKHY